MSRTNPSQWLWKTLAACLIIASMSPSLAADDMTIIHAGTLLARPGETPQSNMTLVISRGRITDIQTGYRNPDVTEAAEVTIIDLRQAFVMPGFIDLHVHLSSNASPADEHAVTALAAADLALIVSRNAQALGRAGFTTVVDMGNGRRAHEQAVYAVRRAIRMGALKGPRIVAAGSPISATGSSRTGLFRADIEAAIGPEGVCNGADDCRRAVREQVRRGADIINFYNTGSLFSMPSSPQTFTDAEMRAIIETAHALGRRVIADGGNTPGDASGINAAIRAGVDIIDTVTYPDAETFRLLKASGGYMVPHVYALEASVGDTMATLNAGSMGWLPHPLLQFLFRLKQEPSAALPAYQAGVQLALGADSGVFPHGWNAGEMVSYVRLGIPPGAALQAATVNAAGALGLDHEIGTLAPGMQADIVALLSNPLEDISAVTRVHFVMRGGEILRSGKE